jgi:hypothetical protein
MDCYPTICAHTIWSNFLLPGHNIHTFSMEVFNNTRDDNFTPLTMVYMHVGVERSGAIPV